MNSWKCQHVCIGVDQTRRRTDAQTHNSVRISIADAYNVFMRVRTRKILEVGCLRLRDRFVESDLPPSSEK